MDEIHDLLSRWAREIYGNSSANPIPILTSIAELVERETEEYLKLPIDPFDDRHPSRSYPDCALGTVLRIILKEENFMTVLTNDYFMSRRFDVQVVSCRLYLDVLPGLESSVFIESESLVPRLLEWADKAAFPLHSYATGLLGHAMNVAEVALRFREQNNLLVPIMLNRLNQITQLHNSPVHNECSNSSWTEAYMSGSYQMHPLSVVMQQRFILQYLAALGEYQELLVFMFEHKALALILHFIDSRKNPDIRLAFDALKFLASFLIHKKFSLEFLDYGGLTQLLKVSKHGIASSGVSICLYFLAYNEDVMEKICWMKKDVLEKMVSYGLWLLEGSHDSSRMHASMFFALCCQFPILLKLFDKYNGLRKLLNNINMRGLMSDDDDISEDEQAVRRQTVRNICSSLKKYVRAHFVMETRRITRTNIQTGDQDSKPISTQDENVQECIEIHRQQSMSRFNFKAIDKMVQEEGISHLLKIVAFYCEDDTFFTVKNDSIRNALEVLVVCSFSPKVQSLLLKEVIKIDGVYTPVEQSALAIVVMCADSKILDADCQKSALNILINLVCPCSNELNSNVEPAKISHTPASARKRSRHHVDLSPALRKATWASNGTMILPNLLTVPSPLTEADAIRCLACRVLCGLAREERIRQIMGKLPIFTDGQLQTLMKEPILPEKRMEHSNFCNYCKELIGLVTGTDVIFESELQPSFQEIERRQIVSQTRIDYDRTEAYHLIHNYLNSEGFSDIALAFYRAANLASKPLPQLKTVNTTKPQTWSPPLAPHHETMNTSQQSVLDTSNAMSIKSTPQIPNSLNHNGRLNIKTPNLLQATPKSVMLQKSRPTYTNMYKKIDDPNRPVITNLDTIFTEYLRYQHSLCKHPVATCPPFELITPHRCPEPNSSLSAPTNIASRIEKRRFMRPHTLLDGNKYDRRYIYSKFRPARLVRDLSDTRTPNNTCAFSNEGHYLFVGTQGGVIKAYNIYSGIIETNYDCHSSPVTHIELSSKDNLMITSSSVTVSPTSILWTFSDVFETKITFENDFHAEFSKTSDDKIVSTQELYARLWDVNTGQMISSFESHHHYTSNRATFSHDDHMILNDGVLYDVRNGTLIHKFGKFNKRINGIFHPNGNEIICNSQIWDLRNFRLLKTVPAFDQCQLKFNTTGDVIFSIIMDDTAEETSLVKSEFKTSFRTFDSYDYSTISTIDLKRTISDLAIKRGDEHIALIESSSSYRPMESYILESNVCKLYEVGKPRYSGDMDTGEDDDDEDDEGAEDEDDDDDEDDDNDLDMDEEDELEIVDDDDSYDDSDDDNDDDDDRDNESGSLLSSDSSL